MQELSALLTTLRNAADIDGTECHATATRVCEILCGQSPGPCAAGTLQEFKTALDQASTSGQNAVYRVDVPDLGHSFAVIQCRREIMIVQSWQSCYSLREWLAAANPAQSIANNRYLPRKGAMDIDIFKMCLDVLSQMFANKNQQRVAELAQELFNPTGVKVAALGIKLNTQLKLSSTLDVKFSRYYF